MAVYSYAEQFEQALQQKYEKELTSYALEQSNPQVKFINAQTIKLPNITVSGYKDHNRSNMGFNTGSISNEWEPKKLAHDRDIEFPLGVPSRSRPRKALQNLPFFAECPNGAMPWGLVPSTTAHRTSGSTTPSRESGSPEHQRYSTGVPACSMVRPISRIKVFLPTPGPPFRIITSYVASKSTISWNRF